MNVQQAMTVAHTLPVAIPLDRINVDATITTKAMESIVILYQTEIVLKDLGIREEVV